MQVHDIIKVYSSERRQIVPRELPAFQESKHLVPREHIQCNLRFNKQSLSPQLSCRILGEKKHAKNRQTLKPNTAKLITGYTSRTNGWKR
jgi:hypothetical protein